MPFDWKRKLLLVPQSAGKNLAVRRLEQFFDGFLSCRWIAREGVSVEDKHAFVDVFGHVNLWSNKSIS